ncbi:uncharacterized protein N7482_005683 [Penicillium canariense]|uniref:Uncharacterized protein n=1 Tax=Penicillium canariense TaxID=189055 RepID=A0A9W9LMS4_9EURO|nr:uncharacterized protein N7482_005683 [Penicillium canariense]KAJ5166902.1 hypothetical protein N7482_005683 [Penicillium canariense]
MHATAGQKDLCSTSELAITEWREGPGRRSKGSKSRFKDLTETLIITLSRAVGWDGNEAKPWKEHANGDTISNGRRTTSTDGIKTDRWETLLVRGSVSDVELGHQPPPQNNLEGPRHKSLSSMD